MWPDARAFFAELYKGVGAGYIEIRPLLDSSDPRRGTEEGARAEARVRRWFMWPRHVAACADYCASLSGREFHVYFGVGLRRKDGGGTKADVGCVTSAFADVDFKDVPREAAHAALASAPPSACVLSGNGVHAYWFLRDPVYASRFSDLERVNRALLLKAGAQTGPQNADRLLRVPGTANIKAKYPDPKPVARVSSWNPERRHDLDELLRLLPALPDPVARPEHLQLRLVVGGGAELAEPALERAARAMAEAWVVGWRHYLALYLGGMCAHEGVSPESALGLVARVCDLSADEESADRAEAVRSSYAKRDAGEKVAGFTKLLDSVKDVFPPALLARAAVARELLRASARQGERFERDRAV